MAVDWAEVGQLVIHSLKTLIITLLLVIIGSVKACLPCNVLPRKSVKGQVVLITGAGGGFGRLLALRFAALGAKLVLWDVVKDPNEETAKQCRKAGAQDVHTYVCNVRNRPDVYALAEKVKQEVGTVDILVNNAGVVTGKALMECTDEEIQRTMDINATSHFWTIRAFLPDMMERNEGHVVSVASSAGHCGVVRLMDYCASKFAAVGLMESFQNEMVDLNKDIKATTICPAFMNTGMFHGVTSKFVPMLTPEMVADRSMEAILTNQKMLVVPKYLYLLGLLKALMPVDASMYLGRETGIQDTMKTFVGHQRNK